MVDDTQKSIPLTVRLSPKLHGSVVAKAQALNLSINAYMNLVLEVDQGYMHNLIKTVVKTVLAETIPANSEDGSYVSHTMPANMGVPTETKSFVPTEISPVIIVKTSDRISFESTKDEGG